MAKADKLLGARLKLKRANKHIKDLERAVRAFKNQRICVVGTKKYPGQPNFNAVYFKSVKRVPDNIAIIAGDALFNLRSALDHAAMQLWIAGHGATRDRTVMFPICDSAAKLRSRLGQVERFGRAAIKAITAIQPYKDGNGHPLWVLNELNNIDKHRLLLATTMAMRPINHGESVNRHFRRIGRAEAAQFKDFFIWDRDVLRAVQRGDIFYGIPKNSDFHKDLDVTCEVAFGEPHIGKGDTALKTLHDLSKRVADILNQLGRLL